VNSLIISQRTSAAVKITGFNLLFNIVLNVILISKYGFVAAACVTLASECVQWFGYTYIVNKHVLKFNFLNNFYKPAIAAAVMGGVVYWLQDHNLWLVVAIGGVVYVLALAAVQFFRAEDRRLLLGGLLAANPEPVERDVL
jgi:O-antigen/teichoic acid export membrane protein